MKSVWFLASLTALTTVASADLGSHPSKYPTKVTPPARAATASLVGSSTLVGGSDSCATPDVITGLGPHSYDNSLATTGAEGQTNPSCLSFGTTAIDNDVWFTWVAPSSGVATLDLCATGTGVDTKVAAYSGVGCPVGLAIGCNDDNCASLESTVVFPVTSGASYTFQVGTYPGAVGGAGTFSISIVTGIPNDDCTAPTVIAGIGPFAYDTTNATTGAAGQNNSRCYIFNTSVIDFDAWYKWTASATGWVDLNTCIGGQHDLKIAVYAGAGCPTGEPLSCDDDRCGTIGASSSAPFFATAGSVYMFQIGSYVGQVGAAGFFTIDPFVPVANDECNSSQLVVGPGPHNWDTTFATTGLVGQNEVLCSNEMITFDHWFRWVADCAGATTLSLCAGSSSDTKISVYQATGCPVTPSLGCNDDFCAAAGPSQVTFIATLGTTYMFQLGHWPGDVPGAGTFMITTSCPPSTGVGYCFGDGSATACPCGNNSIPGAGQGCLNSFGSGATLTATGNPSLGSDSVVLHSGNLPAASVLFFQGTVRQNGGLGTTFGDGLRCAGGTIIRLHTHTGSGAPGSATAQYPDPAPHSGGPDLPVSVRGLIGGPGTRTYQAWYRNIAAFCTPSGFNLTNGLEISWVL